MAVLRRSHSSLRLAAGERSRTGTAMLMRMARVILKKKAMRTCACQSVDVCATELGHTPGLSKSGLGLMDCVWFSARQLWLQPI